jgi:AraC family ethanolamine operon transcriptional activator
MEAVRFEGFDACAAALLRWKIEAVQLDRGSFTGELVQAASPSTLVSEITFGRALHQRGEPPRGMRTLGVLADPAQRIVWRNHRAHGDQLMLFPRGCELDSVSVPGFHVFSVAFDEDRLSEISRALGGTDYEGLVAGREVVDCSPGVMQSLRNAIHQFVRSSAERGEALARPGPVKTDRGLALLLMIVEILVHDEVPYLPKPFRARDLAVRRSLDRIDASEREPLSVVDLCFAAGVSRRTLEYAFLERFGLSPNAYLLARRLDGVRAELKQGHDELSVTQAANLWGFSHLSRFASFYRRQFGELPSESVAAPRTSL